MKKQIEFNLNKGRHGGRRANSGRKRLHSAGVAHRKREKVTRHLPVHINFKLGKQIKNKECLKALKLSIQKARVHGLNVIHWSLQSNHVHLVAETSSNALLTRGMRSLTITFSKAIASGRLQIGRYHLHVLKSLREVQNAIMYVLFNEQKHSKQNRIDDFSSLVTMKEAHLLVKKYVIQTGRCLILPKITLVSQPPTNYLLRIALQRLL